MRAGLMASLLERVMNSKTTRVNFAALQGIDFIDYRDESDFQRAVIHESIDRKWQHHHQYDSRRSISGYPDLILFRERVVWMELKVQNRKLKPAQKEWRNFILSAGGEWYVFWPKDWAKIMEVLA